MAPDNIVAVYDMTKNNSSPSEILKATGAYNPTKVYERVLRYIKNYHTLRRNSSNKAYFIAVDMITARDSISLGGDTSKKDIIATTDTSTSPDTYAILEYAYNSFQKEIVRFIDYQVGKQTQDIKDELDTLRKESKELKELRSSMKNSNWIENLKKKWDNDFK